MYTHNPNPTICRGYILHGSVAEAWEDGKAEAVALDIRDAVKLTTGCGACDAILRTYPGARSIAQATQKFYAEAI